MEIHYFKDPKLNFGDDLNKVIWDKLLSPETRSVDDVVLVGIGSIFHQGFSPAPGRRVIVLGSGTSYLAPPSRHHEWHVLAVRGPFTAEVIGMPDKAVTDGAILLAASGLVPTMTQRNDIVFMPHHKSIKRTPWARIAREAGFAYVSPQQPVEQVLSAFSKAKLVVTEAMHGAIVADTMRIPWVPVITNPTIDEFKWRDWTLSMDLPYAPLHVDVADGSDLFSNRRITRIFKDAGLSGHEELDGTPDAVKLSDYLGKRFNENVREALLQGPRTFVDRATNRLLRLANPILTTAAVRSLRTAAQGRSYLSSDGIFSLRLDQMMDAVRQAERIALES